MKHLMRRLVLHYLALGMIASCSWIGRSPSLDPAVTVSPQSTGTSSATSKAVPSQPAARPRALIAVGEMNAARACHTATRLMDGRVLITGGMQREGVTHSTAELFDPTDGQFRPAGEMNAARVCHLAVLLPDGTVLLAGGWGRGREILSSAEIYDPATGRFAPTGSMGVARGGGAAFLLADGRVLVLGGDDTNTGLVEIYDPATRLFQPAGHLQVGRSHYTATLLPDGNILLAGGRSGDEVLRSAEIYQPSTGKMIPAGEMQAPRHKHAAVLLSDGRVLLLGGADERDWRGRLSSAEIYDPKTGAFTLAGQMSAGRFKFDQAVTLLEDGSVLVAGGSSQVEIFSPVENRFATVSGELDAARHVATATLLLDGRVLITGGYDTEILSTHRAWIY